MAAVDRGSKLSACELSLFECCHCRSSKHDPVQLKCLHCYCRSCLESSGSSSTAVECPACGEVTEVSAVLSNTFLLNHKFASALHSENVWCNACDADERNAELWCKDCCKALCATCYNSHNTFFGDHRIFELEYARCLPLSQLMSSVQCNLHKQQMETQCFTCCEPKCQLCTERCKSRRHDLRVLSQQRTQLHISRVRHAIGSSTKVLGIRLSGLSHKCQAIMRRLQEGRSNGHKLLVKHRRQLKDSTADVFDESMPKLRLNQQTVRYESFEVINRSAILCCTALIGVLSVSGVQNLCVLGGKNLLNNISLRCSSFGKESVKILLQRVHESGSIGIYGCVPRTADIFLSTCLGATDLRRSAPPGLLLFGQCSVTFQAPVACHGLAVTRGGHVLLAAPKHGLLVYSDRGQQLSTWTPARRSDGQDDEVLCVAALSDGRAAVGVGYAQLIVLLRLSQTGDTWLQDRRVAVLQSPPYLLAVHADLLAVAERRPDERKKLWVAGDEVKLLRMGSGQVLYTQSRDYDVHRIALTALCVVTTSRCPMKRDSGARPYVLEAFSHSGTCLWRYETCNEEFVQSVCVSADTWGLLYVALVKKDWSSYRVMAISGADGSNGRDVLSSGKIAPQIPGHLSLVTGHPRPTLAMLSWDRAAAKKVEEQMNRLYSPEPTYTTIFGGGVAIRMVTGYRSSGFLVPLVDLVDMKDYNTVSLFEATGDSRRAAMDEQDNRAVVTSTSKRCSVQ